MAKRILVCGAGGFIASHLVKRLRAEGNRVRGVDLKLPRYEPTVANYFAGRDLRENAFVREVVDRRFNEIFQLAADMGGAGFVFTGANDPDVMQNSATINLNVLDALRRRNCNGVFYSSSACMCPEENQIVPNNPNCAEDSVYPAHPDGGCGWEDLFSERLYLAYARNHGMEVRIARYHNIFRELCSWNDGREKAPAAMCRKVAMAEDGSTIEVWGDGKQTRAFLDVSECLEGTIRLLRFDFTGPINIGSDEIVLLIVRVAAIAGKQINQKHTLGLLDVRGRNSDNRLIQERLDWAPKSSPDDALHATQECISQQAAKGPAGHLPHTTYH